MTKPVIRKESPPKVNAAENPKTLKVDRLPSESIADAVAHAALRLTVQAALTVREYTQGFGEMSINALVGDLVKQCVLASSGDLKRAEATLTAQAHTLDAIFHYLARRAQSAEHLSQLEIYLRLGLKSQSQSRATLETLAAIKNPAAVAFVRQANIAHGPQQVNNGVPPPLEASRARESENSPNKLLSSSAMNGWTPERRKRQAELIRRWKPWMRSTGPKTTEGKAIAARNAYSSATRPLLRELARALRQQRHSLTEKW